MEPQKTNRRQFISSLFPACALLYVGPNSVLMAGQQEIKQPEPEPKHKFDNKIEHPISYRQFYAIQYQDFITMARALEQELGKEKTIELLKKSTSDRLFNLGKMQASRMKDNSFSSYTEQFRSGYDNLLTKNIVEDSDKAFELKVSECIWAVTFNRTKAGDIGYAWVCWGDYAWAEGFNSKIKLVRDKTLMQGHDCCNHRYIWQG